MGFLYHRLGSALLLISASLLFHSIYSFTIQPSHVVKIRSTTTLQPTLLFIETQPLLLSRRKNDNQNHVVGTTPFSRGHGTLTRHYMSSKNDFSLPVILIILLFVAASVIPMAEMVTGGSGNVSIADSVVTRQVEATSSRASYENKQDRLSRSTIQEKLSALPVFYLSRNNDGTMKPDIYMSYQDAKAVADGDESVTVKATTLDQVMYPLILKRGRMRMAPPPPEVQKAEAALLQEDGSQTSYHLIPSAAAVKEAAVYNSKIGENDVPFFVADRLAFATSGGPPQVPLFVSKSDCEFSYQRLRGGKSSLPEQPIIRVSTLLDTLDSMERGTRPGVSQISFYTTAEDINKASEIIE